MGKKVEVLTIGSESELSKSYKKYLLIVKFSLVMLFVILISMGALLHIYFIKYSSINLKSLLKNLPILYFIIMIFSFILFIGITILLIHAPKKLTISFSNSEKEFNSLINAMNLLIISLKPVIDNLSNQPFSKEIKETLIIHKNFLDYILDKKFDYPMILNFTKYFINIQSLILSEIIREKERISNNYDIITKDLQQFYASNIPIKIFPKWKKMIEDVMQENISKLTLGIESLQKMQNHFNDEINVIESKLNNLDDLVKNITKDNTANMENFFSSFNKVNEKIYKDYNTLQSSFASISKTIETIDELSKDISVLAFNIEIEAAKMKESKAFTVLAKEVRNFSNQLSQYYSSINQTIGDINKFLSTTNYDENFIEKNISNYLDQIEFLCGEYDRAFNEIRELNQQLIHQNKENQKIFHEDVDSNLQVLQKLAICLEELEHRNTFTYSIFDKLSNTISDILNLDNSYNNEFEKNQKKQALLEFKKLITTKDEIDFFKNIYEDIVKEKFIEENLEISNKYVSENGKDEGIIIF